MDMNKDARPMRRHSVPRSKACHPSNIKHLEDTLQTYAFSGIGASYSIGQGELQVLQDPQFDHHNREWRALPLSVSLKAAHKRLQRVSRSSWTQSRRDARQRLWDAYSLPSERMTADLFMKVFNDLDEILFDGILRNRVRIRWDNIPNEEAPAKDLLAYAQRYFWLDQHLQRINIVLKVLIKPHIFGKELCWGTLIHEMLHAYLEITTAGHANDKRPPRSSPKDTGHGPLFIQSCDVLSTRLAFPGITPYAISGFVDESIGEKQWRTCGKHRGKSTIDWTPRQRSGFGRSGGILSNYSACSMTHAVLSLCDQYANHNNALRSNE